MQNRLNALFLMGLLVVICTCKEPSVVEHTAVYRPTIGKLVTHLASSIPIIYQDQRGQYWFGSSDQGVYRYDGKHLVQFTTTDGLVNNRIRAIQEDHTGTIYLDTGVGISRFDGTSFSTLLLDTTITAEWQLATHDLWFAGYWGKGGGCRYDGERLYYLKFPEHQLADQFVGDQPHATFSPSEVYTVYQDRKGNWWFGTAASGVSRYDGRFVAWMEAMELRELDDKPALGVRCIVEDKNGDFWFNNAIDYRYRISGASKRTLIVDRLPGVDRTQTDLLEQSIQSMTQDQAGNWWFATYSDGLWRYDGDTSIYYPLTFGGKKAKLFSVYIDRQETLWLASHNLGVLRFNGSTFDPFLAEPFQSLQGAW